jgi:1-acyl-sn-glycerol-3-phosphate acyltransferase
VSEPQRLAVHYRCARFALRLYFGFLCRVRVENAALPEGPFIVSMNHRSALDMVVYVAVLGRRIKFLAKKELIATPILGPILARWCIPIARGRYDRHALEECASALRAGFVLSVFPEGTRHAGLAVAHGGAVLLAARNGVPLVPGAIIGRYGPLQTLTIRFGEPMRLPPGLTRQQRQEATERLLDTIRALGATPRATRMSWRARLRARRVGGGERRRTSRRSAPSRRR